MFSGFCSRARARLVPLVRPLGTFILISSILISSLLVPACDSVPLLAPSETTLSLFAGSAVLPLNGSTVLTATVIEQAGTPVQNGTLVTFVTNLGSIDPAEARTQGGTVTTRLHAGGVSGTATVGAISGSARATDVQIQIGGAAVASLLLSATPGTVPTLGGTVQIRAVVSDASGNRVSGVPVAFATTAGTLSQTTATTDGNGEGITLLTTAREATVTASAGGQEQTVTVRIAGAPSVTLTVQTTTPAAGQATTFAVGVQPGTNGAAITRVRIAFGDGSLQELGSVNGTINVSHTYVSQGTYTVTVTATDVAGEQTVVSTAVVVTLAPVGVVITATPSSAQVNGVVAFTATVTPATTAVVSYIWSFGDGGTAQTTGNQTSHVYTSAGSRTVQVTVNTVTGTSGVGQTVVVVN